MMLLYTAPISHLLTVTLAVLGAIVFGWGVRMMVIALRKSDALYLIYGIRVLIIGFVGGLGALSFGTGNTGFAIVGLLILAEEIYETGTLAAIIRIGRQAEAR